MYNVFDTRLLDDKERLLLLIVLSCDVFDITFTPTRSLLCLEVILFYLVMYSFDITFTLIGPLLCLEDNIRPYWPLTVSCGYLAFTEVMGSIPACFIIITLIISVDSQCW